MLYADAPRPVASKLVFGLAEAGEGMLKHVGDELLDLCASFLFFLRQYARSSLAFAVQTSSSGFVLSSGDIGFDFFVRFTQSFHIGRR